MCEKQEAAYNLWLPPAFIRMIGIRAGKERHLFSLHSRFRSASCAAARLISTFALSVSLSRTARSSSSMQADSSCSMSFVAAFVTGSLYRNASESFCASAFNSAFSQRETNAAARDCSAHGGHVGFELRILTLDLVAHCIRCDDADGSGS